ncbi:MAG TPA: thermonuclease [Mollicutes bacterium]|nr:thermonuclease [Mollicutes bacterium]
MKYFVVLVFSFILLCSNSLASTYKIEVQFFRCVDGDTAKVIINDKVKTVRFLAIDTPEYTRAKEDYGKEAADFTCKRLKGAKTIELELDSNSDEYDRYNRLLAWIWVDDVLLQEEIIKSGLAKVAYLYNDYKYTQLLLEQEEVAKTKKINIWANKKTVNVDNIINTVLILGVIIGVGFVIIKKYKLEIKKRAGL